MESLNLYEIALNEIPRLEDHFKINMDKQMFDSELLPSYFNIKIDNVNLSKYDECIGIIYTFEVNEGTAKIICKYTEYFDSIEPIDWNNVLEEHLNNNISNCSHVFETDNIREGEILDKDITLCNNCNITLSEYEENVILNRQ